MNVERKDLTTVKIDFTGIYGYEVHAPGGLMVSCDADNASQAKRIALRVWNDGLTIKEAMYEENQF